jgi:hypothetical protein
MDINKMLEEEKELDRKAFGENLDKEQESTPPTDEVQEPENNEEFVSEEEESLPEEKATTSNRPSWKQRFANYKASTDNTIYNLRKENAALKLEVEKVLGSTQDLKRQMKELQTNTSRNEDPFKDVFTQEDVEVLGPEAIDVFKRALKSTSTRTPVDTEEIKELREELQRMKEDRIRSAEREAASLEEQTFEKFKSSLTKAVPDWTKIDVDPKFAEFIEAVDPFSGLPRKVLFQRAVQGRDTQRVALFYQDYMKLMPKSKEEILAKKVTPTGSGHSESVEPKAGKVFSLREFEAFMDDYSKGRYKGKEKEAQLLEAKFDKAFREGRIR